MRRFDSEPLPLSPAVAGGAFSRAQLIFYEVDHSGPSFQAPAFLNAATADLETPLSEDSGFAGSFTIFGHGGCAGEDGHCHVPEKVKDPFDNRPLHPLTRHTKTIDVTAALKRIVADPEADHEHLLVTVLPVVLAKEGPELGDVLFFSAMRFVAYV